MWGRPTSGQFCWDSPVNRKEKKQKKTSYDNGMNAKVGNEEIGCHMPEHVANIWREAIPHRHCSAILSGWSFVVKSLPFSLNCYMQSQKNTDSTCFCTLQRGHLFAVSQWWSRTQQVWITHAPTPYMSPSPHKMRHEPMRLRQTTPWPLDLYEITAIRP